MAITIPPPQPGDLITAAFMKQLIDLLSTLDQRVTLLEAAAPGSKMMQIFAPLTTDTFRVGDELRIVGQGFGIPQLDTVLFDQSIRVSAFKPGSNDNLLILDIPSMNVGTGKVVSLIVSNNIGAFAQTSFNLLPPVQTVPAGALSMSQIPTGQQTVTPNGAFNLFFNIGTTAMLTDTTTFSPVFSNAPGWDAFLADAQNNRISSDFQITPQSVMPVHVRVSVPNGATGTASLIANFVSKNNPATVKSTTSGVLLLPVNGLVPGAEKIGAAVGTVLNGQAQVIQPDPQGVYAVPSGPAAAFPFTIAFPPGSTAANYSVTAALGSTTGWPNNAVGIAQPPLNNTTGKNTFVGATGQRTAQITVAAQAGAPQTTLTLTVTADNDPTGTVGHLTLLVRGT